MRPMRFVLGSTGWHGKYNGDRLWMLEESRIYGHRTCIASFCCIIDVESIYQRSIFFSLVRAQFWHVEAAYGIMQRTESPSELLQPYLAPHWQGPESAIHEHFKVARNALV